MEQDIRELDLRMNSAEGGGLVATSVKPPYCALACSNPDAEAVIDCPTLSINCLDCTRLSNLRGDRSDEKLFEIMDAIRQDGYAYTSP
ncbi:hypothetical protein GF362_02395 [Candidatus Dojkabacteria bacterium]|nr:hypothetical protein [Candidatus Dojkabacteria bacterium]